MRREDFFKKIFRIALLAILSLIAFTLGGRVVSGQNCSSCPGNGVCKGETDCSKY